VSETERAVSTERDVTITLTNAQIARVVRAASGGAQLAGSLSGIGSLNALRHAMLPLLDDRAYSHSTFRAVIVFAAFPEDGSERELTDIARTIGLSPSTTYRYARTLAAVGLLEQHPDSRQYRRTHVKPCPPVNAQRTHERGPFAR
jgi:DNA-binding IscR family transcriptional regulator